MRSIVTRWTTIPAVLAFALGLTGLSPVTAQSQEQQIQQSVGRISYLSGNVSYMRGDDPDDWQNATRNVPVTIGDRVYSGPDGQVELALEHGNYVRLAGGADFTTLNMTGEINQFSLMSGTALLYVRSIPQNVALEVDTPNVAVTLLQQGVYRLDVDQDGNTIVRVRRGEAEVAAGGGQVSVHSGEDMQFQGIDAPQYDYASPAGMDSYDRWADMRQAELARSQSYRYVNSGVVGAEDLDSYGRWDEIPQYGRVWTPTTVEIGWQPYRTGHWVWQDPWGWTWIADEPWGWAPYHYGRWVAYQTRWYWVPVSPTVPVCTYSPALVAFVGGGPGWSASVSIGQGGYVGWFPLAPSDPFVPWWGSQTGFGISLTSGTYANRASLTVVDQNTFISGGIVATSAVRDPVVIRQVSAAQVQRGAVPLVPTTASLRMAGAKSTSAVKRPPPERANRTAVTRIAPPAAPPRFQAKQALIKQNKGAPVAPATAAKMAVEQEGAKPAVAVRPAAAAPGGKVSLAPRGARAPRPEPVKPSKGKALATSERPIVSTPDEAEKPTAPAPKKIAPGAVAHPKASQQEEPRKQPAAQPEKPRPPERAVPEAQKPEPRGGETVKPKPEQQQPPQQALPEKQPPTQEKKPEVKSKPATAAPAPTAKPEPSKEQQGTSASATQKDTKKDANKDTKKGKDSKKKGKDKDKDKDKDTGQDEDGNEIR